MLGDTITLYLGGSGGTAFTMQKVNQDGYSSEYRFNSSDGLRGYVLKIKHTKEASKEGRPALDRHYVSLLQTVYATATVPEYQREFYFVFRCKPNDVAASTEIATALTFWASAANLDKLRGWES